MNSGKARGTKHPKRRTDRADRWNDESKKREWVDVKNMQERTDIPTVEGYVSGTYSLGEK
jgi:hypothetical protein